MVMLRRDLCIVDKLTKFPSLQDASVAVNMSTSSLESDSSVFISPYLELSMGLQGTMQCPMEYVILSFIIAFGISSVIKLY